MNDMKRCFEREPPVNCIATHFVLQQEHKDPLWIIISHASKTAHHAASAHVMYPLVVERKCLAIRVVLGRLRLPCDLPAGHGIL
jgi:hypothetical protein